MATPKLCPDCNVPLVPKRRATPRDERSLAGPSDFVQEWTCRRCHGREWSEGFDPSPTG